MSRQTHGLRDWLLQRISAVYLAGFLVYLFVYFLPGGEHSFQQWHDWMTRPAMLVASAAFVLAVLLHGWVGMRDVVLDYVHPLGVRLLVLTLIGLMLAAFGMWALLVLVLAAG